MPFCTALYGCRGAEGCRETLTNFAYAQRFLPELVHSWRPAEMSVLQTVMTL